MVWPLEQEIVREFAAGLEEVFVVEEKLPFLESAVKEALYGLEDAPRVVGKRDERGASLLPAEGELDADLIARAVASRLGDRVQIESVRERVLALERAGHALLRPLPIHRTPYYCSGCPHNSSTVEMGDALVGVGIGCHTMVLLNPEGKGTITGITQMGGEGAQWIGMAPFTESPHFFQNVGDGTFHHSASLALRAAARRGRQRHLQAALQQRRRDDRRAGRHRPHGDPRAHALARAGGRQADHHHRRRARALRGRRRCRRSPRCAAATRSRRRSASSPRRPA